MTNIQARANYARELLGTLKADYQTEDDDQLFAAAITQYEAEPNPVGMEAVIDTLHTHVLFAQGNRVRMMVMQ